LGNVKPVKEGVREDGKFGFGLGWEKGGAKFLCEPSSWGKVGEADDPDPGERRGECASAEKTIAGRIWKA